MAVLIPHHIKSHTLYILLSPHLSPSLVSAMATLQFLALSSPASYCSLQKRSLSGLVSLPWSICPSLQSSFNGQSLQLPQPRWAPLRGSYQISGAIMMMVKPKIQFIQGTDEQTIPDVRLTKSRDGTNGVAIFSFEQPSVFDSSGEVGEITGFYMIDEEGVLTSVNVNAKFVNGKPAGIEAKYIMRTTREWDRFMRFMERYSDANGLQFIKK